MSSNYTQGYSNATVSSHASRTVSSDAAFLLPHIQPTDHILDVGCGPGSITVGFAALAFDGTVVGVDIAEEVLARARALAAEDASKTKNVTFQKADLLAGLPFADGTFDVVFSSQLFPHLASHTMRLRAITEMRRVLKPGGILATRDCADLHFYPLSYDLDRVFTRNMVRVLRNGQEDARWPGGEMPALYREAGFAAAPGKMKVGAGTTVHSGESRQWYGDGHLGRLSEGDPYRASWIKAGVSEEQIYEAVDVLKRWAADEDAWYVALQCEVVAWK